MSAAPETEIFKSSRNAGQTTAFRVYKSQSPASRTPLVLIQGMSAVGTVDWHDLATVLTQDRTVVTFDNRDMHGSKLAGQQAEGFTLEDLAQDVVDLVQFLGFREVDICGHSMGGMIAQTLLTMGDLPIKINHAILGATAAKAPRSDLGVAVAQEMKKARTQDASDKRTKAQKDRQLTEIFMKYCYDPQWIKDNPDLYERRIQESLSTRRPAKTVALQQRAIGKYDVRAKLPHVPKSLPVLVIHGTQDVAVYPDEKDHILQGIAHAQVAQCPRGNYGHNWYDYFGEEFWRRTFAEFLDGNGKLASKL